MSDQLVSDDEDQPLVQLKKPEPSVVTPSISIPKEKESSSAPASASSSKKRLSLSKTKTEESTALRSPTQSSPPKVEILVPTPALEGKKDDDDDLPLSTLAVNKKSLKLKKEPAVKKETVGKDKLPQIQTPIKKVKVAVGLEEPAPKKEKAPMIKKEKAKESNKDDNDAEDENDSDASETFIPRHIEDNTEKWQTLEHSGVFFPPAYEPHQEPLIYNGESLILPPEAEEVAGFYAAMITTDYAKSDIFNKNFFQDFRSVLQRTSPLLYKKVTDFTKCDFTVMAAYFEQQKEKKKQMTKAEKLVIKEQKLALDQIYGFAYLDGRKEKVGNYRIEPPGLFRGRGQHPKAGCLKQRVQPEQVTINIGSEAKVPEPPAGHHWKEVVHNNTVTWLATWTENVNGQPKYVFLGATSSLKGQSDFMKFEKARELKNHIDHIRTVNFRNHDADAILHAFHGCVLHKVALSKDRRKLLFCTKSQAVQWKRDSQLESNRQSPFCSVSSPIEKDNDSNSTIEENTSIDVNNEARKSKDQIPSSNLDDTHSKLFLKKKAPPLNLLRQLEKKALQHASTLNDKKSILLSPILRPVTADDVQMFAPFYTSPMKEENVSDLPLQRSAVPKRLLSRLERIATTRCLPFSSQDMDQDIVFALMRANDMI